MDINNNNASNIMNKINVPALIASSSNNNSNNNMDHQQENISTKDSNSSNRADTTMASTCIYNSNVLATNVANKSSSHFDNQLNILNNNFHLDQILCNLFIFI
jgi:hypothetical protein